MPMKTTLVTAGSPFGRGSSSRCASQTWPMISAAVRLRLKPCLAVAQKAQSSAQPTCDEMHRVPRSGSGMNTVSTACPPPAAVSHFTVPSADWCREMTRGSDTDAASPSAERRDLARSVISPKSVMPRRCSHCRSWRARNGFSPRPAKNASSSSRDSPSSSCLSTGMVTPQARSSAGAFADAIGEEEGDLPGRRLRRVRAVHHVLLDALGEIRADGALVGVRGVRRTHEVAVHCDGILPFQRLHHNRPRAHVGDQVREERALLVHGVEVLGLRLRQVQHAGGDDLQARILEPAVDLSDDVLLHAVGLDDGERLLTSHGDSFVVWFTGLATGPPAARLARSCRVRKTPGPRTGREHKLLILLGLARLGNASDVETLAAAALARHIRVAELERFVQALFDEVHFRTVDVGEAVVVHDDLDAVVLEHVVAARDLVRVVDDVGEAGTAGLLHTEAQAQTPAACADVIAYPVRCGLCQ